jgi:hypothetical protein
VLNPKVSCKGFLEVGLEFGGKVPLGKGGFLKEALLKMTLDFWLLGNQSFNSRTENWGC